MEVKIANNRFIKSILSTNWLCSVTF
jgi:hypothetical protein